MNSFIRILFLPALPAINCVLGIYEAPPSFPESVSNGAKGHCRESAVHVILGQTNPSLHVLDDCDKPTSPFVEQVEGSQ